MAKGPGGFSVGRVSIQVVPDTSEFRRKLKTELEKAVKGMKVEIPVDVDAARAVTQLKALDTILKRLDGRNINIGANVNSKGDLEKISNNLSKVGRSASQAADGFSSMSRTGAIALAVLLLIAPALALIATLLAGLPSLLFAFGGAALAVGLGMEGIKKAAAGFTPTIDRLKKSLSATFAKQLTQPFIDLNKIAPVLDKGLNAIAVSISKIISDMIKFVTSARGMEQLNTILANTARFFERLSPAITNGLNALFTLAAEASKEFDVLTDTLNRFSKNFLDMVNRVAQNGTLASALRNLNIVLDSLLDAFTQFFEAGLKAMTVLGGPITVLFDGFTKAIVALMPILTAISKLVFDVLGEAFKQLAPIFEALTPTIQTLGDLLGQILVGALKVLGPLLTVVATILNQVFLQALKAIAPFIQPFLDFLTTLGLLIGETLLAAFTALQPFLNQFFKFVTDLLIAITPLLPVILEFATVVLKALADIFRQIGPELVLLGQDLFPQLLQMVKQLVPVVSDLIKMFMELVPPIVELAAIILDIAIPIMQSLLQVISEVWPAIQQIIQGALTYIQGIINVVMGLINGDWERVWKGIQQIVEGSWEILKSVVRAGVTAVLDFFIGLPARILSSLAGLPGSMLTSGRAMMKGLIDGITSMAGSVVNAALGVVKQVRDLLPFSPAKDGPFSGKGYTLYSGRALMEDWARGIEQGAPRAVTAMEDAMAMAQTGLDIQAAVTAEGFGGIGVQVAKAIEGMEIKADGTQIARVVNKTNNMNARR